MNSNQCGIRPCKRISSRLISLIILILISYRAPHKTEAAQYFDPAFKWKSLKTEHFWIHYHQGLEPVALKMTELAESVHRELVREIGWKPSMRTDVVLVDSSDLSNGMAMPFPYNRVEIYISRPMNGSVLSTFDNWLKLVFLHEYTHILNIDMISGFPSATRNFPGRCCFPNAFVPVWVQEGSSVLHESMGNGMGRNNSSYVDMIIRMEVLSGEFKSISEASHFPRSWPRGNVPYLYGGLFIDYLEKRYGKRSFAEFMHENSDNLIPYSDNIYPIPCLFNKDAKDVYGKSFPRLWKEWEKFIKEKYTLQYRSITEKPLTPEKIISHHENDSLLPRFNSSGTSIFYIKKSSRDQDRLTEYNIAKKTTGELSRVFYPNSLTVKDNGEVYLTDVNFFRSFSLYYDIYRSGDDSRQLTRGKRTTYIDVSADGKQFTGVRTSRDRYSLFITGPGFRDEKEIIKNSRVQISSPRFSPDGERIVFTIKDERGFTDLAVYSRSTGSFTRLTSDLFSDIQPDWHPDGKRIVFSSDRNGIFNLYEYSLINGRISPLTNLVGGGFTPDISPDGKKIVFASYKSGGHVISLMDYPDKPAVSGKGDRVKLSQEFFTLQGELKPEPSGKYTPSSYNPVYSVLPTLLIPLFAFEEIYTDKNDMLFGAATFGWDTLFRHNYYLMAYGYREQKRATVIANYTYSRFYPDISLGYVDENLFFGEDKFPWEGENRGPLARELSRFGFISIYFPFNRISYRQMFQLSYIYERVYTDTYLPGNPVEKTETTFPRIQGVYTFSNTENYVYSISSEKGRYIMLMGDVFNDKIGSDSNIFRGRIEYSEFLPGFLNNNVLMARLRGGFTRNNREYLSQYDIGNENKRYRVDESFDSDQWGMRGYVPGSEYGDNIATATLEYRFPLLQADAGILTIPVMFRDIWMNLFVEYGDVWNGSPDINDFRTSAGAELHIKFTLGYWLDLVGFVGYAAGFDRGGEKVIYYGISTTLDELLNNKIKRVDYLR